MTAVMSSRPTRAEVARPVITFVLESVDAAGRVVDSRAYPNSSSALDFVRPLFPAFREAVHVDLVRVVERRDGSAERYYLTRIYPDGRIAELTREGAVAADLPPMLCIVCRAEPATMIVESREWRYMSPRCAPCGTAAYLDLESRGVTDVKLTPMQRRKPAEAPRLW